MYKPDDSLQLPPQETRIWRFMDLPALFYILQRRRLFFRSINKMNDPYDGYMPEYVYERYWDWEMGRSPEDHPLDIISAGVVQKAVRQITFVNCWHMNSEESAAMWALYPN